MAFDWQSETGPNPQMAQVWTPPAAVDLLWRWMVRSGWSPDPTATVADLAAGNGRLVEGAAPYCRLVLNELDPRLVATLRARFPGPQHITHHGDFRWPQLAAAIGMVDAAVGAPPWMEAPDGDYLPQRYIDVCGSLLKPGGLLGVVLPDWFEATTPLRLIIAVHVMPAKLADWPFPEKPVIHVFRKEAAPQGPRREPVIRPV